MKSRKGAVFSLVLLATCAEGGDQRHDDVEPARHGLGTVPPSEVAVWKKYGAGTVPDERYLQSVAFDESRKVLVMFGGMTGYWTTPGPTQDVWEWSPATGTWTERVATGSKPPARSGAGWVFDSTRNKFVLFGGRAGSGYDYQDTWEWDPATGSWTDRTGAGPVPTARCQAMMVFEKPKNLVLLFGGQRSVSSDPMDNSSSVSFGDTWEWDTTTGMWTSRSVATGPAGRFDASLVWDDTRKKAVLFAGMQKDSAGVAGVPKQDTWEWDPETSAWTERTVAGEKPSPRWGQAAAFDGSRSKLVVFGGWDINNNYYLNDIWDWDPTTGAWKQRLTGSEPNLPNPRVYASLISNDAVGRLELVAGMTLDSGRGGTGGMGGIYGTTWPYSSGIPGNVTGIPSREVWELDPVAPVFSKRPDPLNSPGRRTQHAMAYCPDTGKTYVFGGLDDRYVVRDDLWEWDGGKWSLVDVDARPAARADAGLAYDPVRKSLILYGGADSTSMFFKTYDDTWEWSPVSRKWSQLSPTTRPTISYGHVMLTDRGRGKIILFGGMPGMIDGPYKEPMQGIVWEWDGAKVTWTNRTSVGSSQSPGMQMYPLVSYDESRQKLLVFPTVTNYAGAPSNSNFWEWDAYSSGWSLRDPGDSLNPYNLALAVYDSSRRRTMLVTDAVSPVSSNSSAYETRELDSKGPTWYVRYPKTPPTPRANAAMAYDSKRGIIVLFGGTNNLSGFATDETWEYSVSGLGKGSGCSSDFASACDSGNCVDGVCCESASCIGPCQSCNVSGKEGSCIAAQAGTEVAGSCSAGQACDGNGACKSKNGSSCLSSGDCASGHCADGVCCNSECRGTCEFCNQPERAGLCSPYVAGRDPEGECKKGAGPCSASCNGAGACALPAFGSPCGDCMICDGGGTCMASFYDPRCMPPFGGTGGNSYTTRTSYGGSSGSGGFGGTSWTTRSSYGGSFGGTSPSAGRPIAGRSSSGGAISFGGSAGSSGGGGSSIRSSTGGSVVGGARSSSGGGGGGSSGSVPNGGSGGSIISSSRGSSPRDGGAGSSGNRDAGGPDVSRSDASSTTRLGSAGCACSLGSATSNASIVFPATAMVGLLLRRRRSRG